jgi:hypothetical protein
MSINRRDFLKTLSLIPPVAGLNLNFNSIYKKGKVLSVLNQWQNPSREFSQAPFWFWNDELSEKEISRQLDDFCSHGVYGFVIHPRAGLPKSIGWMSDKMIFFMRYTIEEAAKKKMWVLLYDEGMYPSGSSSGQVVAVDRSFRPRGLFAIDLDEVKSGEEQFGFTIGNNDVILKENQKLVAIVKRKTNGHRIAVVDRYITPGYALIRGLHFLDPNAERREDKKEVSEEMPELADILNPDAVKCFIKLVYQRYYDEFGQHFGKTVKAIFTDEPSFFGKKPEKGSIAGNKDVLNYVSKLMKKDITENLPSLWFDDEPEVQNFRSDYYRGLNTLLEQTYYKPISDWCTKHKIDLTGHPEKPDDIGHLRYFQIPGQDIVYRFIEPGKPSALEGQQSTQVKCTSSAMIHLKRRRNSNEYCGAFGHNFTFREMKWLANWLLIRGCNLLYPHAFYYSVRGPRIDERPPDVGPNNIWWNEFKPFADFTSRLCWLNTDSKHVCDIAILGLSDYLPWKSAKVCFQNQIDFNYIEERHLHEDANIDSSGIHLAGMRYKALIIEDDLLKKEIPTLDIMSKRIIRWNSSQIDGTQLLLNSIQKLVLSDVIIFPKNENIRIRHTIKNGYHFYMLFNEGETDTLITVQFSLMGKRLLLNSSSNAATEIDAGAHLIIESHQLKVIMIDT